MDRRVYRWPLLGAVVVLVLIGFFCLMNKTQGEIDALLAEEEALLEKRAVADDVYAALMTQLRLVGSEGFVKNEARKNYDFINKGEVCFEFTNEELLKNYTEEEAQIILEETRYW